jgi:hypothetical protein
MATRRIPDPKIGGSIPSEVISFFALPVTHPSPRITATTSNILAYLLTLKRFPRRDLNPGLVGENHIS